MKIKLIASADRHKITTQKQNTMKNLNLDLLLPLLAVESESWDASRMVDHVRGLATSNNCLALEDHAGNLWLEHVSTLPGRLPLIVAHLDTVHEITGHLEVLRRGELVAGYNPAKMQASGIGGDDKCGIYAALHLLLAYPGRVRVLLTQDEEVGGVGAYAADAEEINRIASYMLQADRRGSADCVVEACGSRICSRRMQAHISRLLPAWGFAPCAQGGFTDVYALQQSGVQISAINLSAGYHRPHSPDEYIHLGHLSQTVGLMCSIVEALGETSYPFVAEPPVHRRTWSHTWREPAANERWPFPDYEPSR